MSRPQRPFTDEQLRYLRDYYPGLGNQPPGVDLGEALRSSITRSRPDYDPEMDAWLATQTALYVDNSKAESSANDGTEGKPFASIAEALLTIPHWRTLGRTIQLLLVQTGTPYKMPGNDPFDHADRIDIVGVLPAPVSGLSSIAVDTTNALGPAVGGYDLLLTLAGRSADDMRGLFFAESSGRYGWVFQNDATSGTTRARMSQDRDAGPNDPISRTFDFYDPAGFVQIDLDGNDMAMNWCNQLTFTHISFIDSSGSNKGIVTQAGARVNWTNCHFSATINRMSLFEAQCLIGLRNNYFETAANSAKFGQLAVNRAFGLFLNLRSGNVFDARNASNNTPIAVHEGILAALCFQGCIVFRGCDSMKLDGHAMVGLNEGYNTNRAIYVYEHSATDPIMHFEQRIDTAYTAGMTGQQLPDLHGTIDGDYCLVFSNCTPRLGRGTAVTCDASGTPITNQISGDDGASACCGTAFHRSWCTVDRDTDVAGWPVYEEAPASASPSITLDGKNGSWQHVDLTGSTGTATIDFRELQIGGWLDLQVTQAATAITITWTGVVWSGGVAPSIGNGAVGQVRLHWDGTTIRGVIMGNAFS